jgi:hypothetical protein
MVRAIGAGLPVIASDERLMGRLVRDLGLGLLFSSGDASALRESILAMAKAGDDQMTRWRAAARATAPKWSRSAFRQALLGGFDEMNTFRKMDGSVEHRASIGG